MPDGKLNIFDLDRNGLEALFLAMGEKPFRATQVLKWVHQQGVRDFSAMSNLGKDLRRRLQERLDTGLPEVVRDTVAGDGTRKLLLRLADGNCIETVFIPETDRGTLCVSSQVGCTLNCTFCATARQGYNRNLTVAEIIAQIWISAQLLNHTHDKRVITNVVLMGMGEPLMNFDNVVTAVKLMMDDLAWGLSKRRITLSTSGVVPALDRLRDTGMDISLAVSLHASTDAVRDKLVPINKKYPIDQLLAACRRYLEVSRPGNRKVTFEYVMLKDVNDSDKDARRLINLMSQVPSKVNLIPFNGFENSGYQCSDEQRVERFRDILGSAGIVTVVRKTRGEDIDAACGQLAGRVMDRTRRSQEKKVIFS